MSSKPLVSIVITTYYRNNAAREAVRSALYQENALVEVILVDGSGDRHAKPLAGEFQITYLPQDENRGIVSDRNLGFEHANGRYINFLDDDDKLRPRAIHRKLMVIEDNDEIGVVYSGLYRARDDKILLPAEDARGDFLEHVLRHQQPPCYPSTMLIDATVLESILPLDPKFDGADDVVLITELAKRTKFDFVHDDLLQRGEEEESMAATMNAVETRRMAIDEYANLYEKYPTKLRRAALAGTYSIEGQVHLSRGEWSVKAIRAFALAVHYSPGIRIDFLGSFLASILGRRVWVCCRRGFVKLRKWRES